MDLDPVQTSEPMDMSSESEMEDSPSSIDPPADIPLPDNQMVALAALPSIQNMLKKDRVVSKVRVIPPVLW